MKKYSTLIITALILLILLINFTVLHYQKRHLVNFLNQEHSLKLFLVKTECQTVKNKSLFFLNYKAEATNCKVFVRPIFDITNRKKFDENKFFHIDQLFIDDRFFDKESDIIVKQISWHDEDKESTISLEGDELITLSVKRDRYIGPLKQASIDLDLEDINIFNKQLGFNALFAPKFALELDIDNDEGKKIYSLDLELELQSSNELKSAIANLGDSDERLQDITPLHQKLLEDDLKMKVSTDLKLDFLSKEELDKIKDILSPNSKDKLERTLKSIAYDIKDIEIKLADYELKVHGYVLKTMRPGFPVMNLAINIKGFDKLREFIVNDLKNKAATSKNAALIMKTGPEAILDALEIVFHQHNLLKDNKLNINIINMGTGLPTVSGLGLIDLYTEVMQSLPQQ